MTIYNSEINGVLQEIADERTRQIGKGFDPRVDDKKSVADWVNNIHDWAGWARAMAGMGGDEGRSRARRRLIQVAALAMAAVESIDRKERQRSEERP